MLSMMIKILVLFKCIIFTVFTVGVPATFAQVNFMKSGTIQPVSSLKSATDVISTYPVNYLTTLATGQTGSNTIISLSSFECLSSNQFSFNISVLNYTLTGFTWKLQIIGNTFFNLIKVNYLSMVWTASSFNTDIIYNDCFLTTALAINGGTTNRTQNYAKQTFAVNITNGDLYKVQSFITGLKFLNNKDIYKKVEIKSKILSATNYINHTISVNGNTQLQWVCIGTVIIQTMFSNFLYQIYSHKIGSFNVKRTPNQSIDMSNFPIGYTTKYGLKDTKFFGLSSLEMYLGKPYQIINVKTQNILTVQVGYQGMATAGAVGFFFMSYRICSGATPLYSLVDNLCYAACTEPGQYAITAANPDVCDKCHYSCSTCSGSTDTTCSSCNSTINHRFLNGTKCNCSPGYVQNNVAICPPCSNFIPNCNICSSKTICTNCTGIFVFYSTTNVTSPKCDCPNNTYFIPNDVVCAVYPGCIVADVRTNYVFCFACNTSQHFYLDDNTLGNTYQCKCETFYVQNGSTCVDLCGDGINLDINSTTYCDDGNLNSTDGCSATCSIQAGFGCFNPPMANISFCSPIMTYKFKYLYAQRVVNQNAGIFLFQVSPPDYQLANSGFTYYVQTTMPHTTAIGSYDVSTSILRVKVSYLKTIQEQAHTMKITLDPYRMSVTPKIFTFTATGVNYDLTYDQNPQMNTYIFWGIAAISGLIVIAALVITFINYKIAAVQLLMSAQIIYLGVVACNDDSLSIYPLTNLRYLAGFNTYQQFQISKYNYNTPFLLSSYSYAQFLLNFNFMGAILAVVIFIILPLKLNVAYKYYKRDKYTSPQMQEKLMQQDSGISLKQLSTDIKSAQLISDTYIDRVYFGFSLIVFLPIVVFFALQLGFIGKIGRYQLNTFANIILSILLLMIDFCFFILVFQDTDRKMKTFNFGSKKLKAYPYRLMMFYFTLSCMMTIVLLTDMAFYILFALTLLLGIYIVIENPFDKLSFQYFDSISKPLISLVGLGLIKSMSFFSSHMVFLPIAVFAILFISLVMTIIRVIKIKLNRADVAKKILQESADLDEDVEFDKNLKSQFGTQKSKNKGKNTNQNNNVEQTDEQKGNNNQNSGRNIINNDQQGDQIVQDNEDQLAKIKRSLRQDLKKRRGVINKVNDDQALPSTQKKVKKLRKLKHTIDVQNNYGFI